MFSSTADTQPFFYTPVPGRLLAGEHPTWTTLEHTRLRLQALLKAGVTYFLDLTEQGEELPYNTLLLREAAKVGRTVKYRRCPLKDRATLDAKAVEEILDLIDAAVADGHLVYLHCYAGIGRTGTMVGCYLVRGGLSGEEALAEIARRREGSGGGPMSSPNLEEQRQLVLNWKAGS